MSTSRVLAPETERPPYPAKVSFGRQHQATLPVRKKPDFFLVGAPKCGTTAMAEYLAGHPDIFMARKEMHVFGQDLRFSEQFYRRDLEEYLAEHSDLAGKN